MLRFQAELAARGDLLEIRKPACALRAAASRLVIQIRAAWLVGRAAAVGLLVAAPLLADPPAERAALVVGVADIPPLVVQSGEGLQGFDIDIWNEVSAVLGVDSSYRLLRFDDLMEAVERGEVDAAIAGISMTRDRERVVDFSHPYFDSGLRILTTLDNGSWWLRLLRSLGSAATLEVFGSLVVFVLLCAHVLFLVERGASDISYRYWPGILEACWCVLATITTVGYGDVTPRSWLGRFASVVTMLIGIALFGVAISHLSTALMMEALKSEISGPEDLDGRSVATVSGTTSSAAAIRYGARLRETDTIAAAYRLLEGEDVDAILFDAVPLMRYAVEDGNNTVSIVGPLIEKQSYAIAFPAGSELRESVNRALLELEESGRYARIRAKWFGFAN